MGSGGARINSGPPPDPRSGRSERRGIQFTALPADGYDGPVPRWPLPKRTVWLVEVVDKVRFKSLDEGATEAVQDRELALWEWAWRTPQAWAWAQPSESWRLHSIAMWVRTFVLCESSEATAADKNSLHRFADDIGMSPAGLRANGWAIAKDEVGAKRAATDPESPAPAKSSRSRMKVVRGGG